MATTNFMETPLVVWVQSFHPEPLTFKDLQEGVFLNKVLHQIDPRAITEGVSAPREDLKELISNWDTILKNIKAYYQDVLQQLIVMKLPNIMVICKQGESDAAKVELERVLLLILGCAVQCDDKEQFIHDIKRLDIYTQQAIVDYIKEITDDSKNVFAIDMPADQMNDVSRSMHNHLRKLIQERDGYIEEIKELTTTVEDLYSANQDLTTQQLEKGQSMSPQAGSPEKQEKAHLAVELAEIKAKMRRLRQEMEEKTELVLELQEELDDNKATLTKLRSENLDLTQDARAARTYRDEVDILKEKASRVDKYESEITKYKEKLNELDFFKARVDELRDDNNVLLETRATLEKQLESSHHRIETVVALEDELLRLKQEVTKYSQQRDDDRNRIQELIEENARLGFENKTSFNESANLEEELSKARQHSSPGMSNTLSDQLNETANARILRLELENQKLQKRLEEAEENQLLENANQVLELEKENRRLSNKVEKLQMEHVRESKGAIELESITSELSHEKKQLQETLETVKESGERQVRELERENEQLQQTVSTLRERNEKTHDMHIKDTEKENKKLHENVKNLTSQVSNLSYEHKQLQKAHDRLKDSEDNIREVAEDNQTLERENDDLQKEVSTLKRTCDQYEQLEQQYLDIEVERDKMVKVVESLKKAANKVDTLEEENTNLTVEVQHMKRVIENMKNTSTRAVDLEQEKDGLNREVQQLKKALEVSRMDKTKQEQLEFDLLELDTENQKLQRSVEALSRRVHELEQDNTELDNHSEKLQKSLEGMRLSLRKLDDLERENKDMELEMTQLTKDKASCEKENKKLKLASETREAQFDEINSKMATMERENKSMRRQVERTKDVNVRMKELEKENMEVVQQATIDKKTLNTLREELVNEKIRAQDLNNEVERVSSEADRSRMDHQKLVYAELANDESKLNLTLEQRLEGGLKQALEMKEEKISSLESRLEAARKHNLKVQDELKHVRRDYEVIVQQNEDLMVASLPEKDSKPEKTERFSGFKRSNRPRPHEIPNATKEILKLKDHIITVERTNASLEEETKHLKSMASSLKEQTSHLQTQNSKLQSQLASVQTQYNMLQSQYANLQVESKTLQSQSASLMSQNATLQKSHSDLETDHEQLLTYHSEQQAQHEILTNDHEQLAKLHEQLATEYEALISEHGSLKANFKAAKSDNKELHEQNMYLSREKETIGQLKEMLQRDHESIRTESNLSSNIQLDYVRLKEDLMHCQHAKEKALTDLRGLGDEHKSLKFEYNQLKMRHSDSQSQLSEARSQVATLEMEVSRLLSKLESLTALNEKLEDDNRNLMMQLQALLNQNQELLTGCLDSKDQLQEEQKAYMERLAELRRQKEKLEEKIMEQYKRYDPVKKNENIMMDSPRFGGRSDNDSVSSGNNSNQQNEWQERPIRSRQLLESSSMSSFSQGRPGSLSGGGGGGVEGEDESDGELTLEQFLRECDKSPKSRRKMIKEIKDQEKKDIKKGRRSNTPRPEPETMALSPNLGPRGPTIEKDDQRPRSPFKSKSEMNLTKLTTYSSGSSFGQAEYPLRDQRSSYSPHTRDPLENIELTSTPKQQLQQEGRYVRERTPSSGGDSNLSGPRGQVPHNGVNGYSPSSGQSTPDSHPLAGYGNQNQNLTPRGPHQQHYQQQQQQQQNYQQPQQQQQNYHQQPQTPPTYQKQQPMREGYPQSNNISHHGSMQQLPRQNSGSSTGSGSIGSYNAMTRMTNSMQRSHTIGGGMGQNSVGGGGQNLNGSQTLPRQRPRQDNSASPYRSGSTDQLDQNPQYQRYPSQDRPKTPSSTVNRPKTPNSSVSSQRPVPNLTQPQPFPAPQVPRRSSTPGNSQRPKTPPNPSWNNNNNDSAFTPRQQQQQQREKTPETDGYNPGNVRSLVHNFQISMTQQHHQSGSPTSNGPAPPPRRSRPMSAGPLRSSTNSAFSVPRPSTPNQGTNNNNTLERNTGRTLPMRPDERMMGGGGVGLTTGRTLPHKPDERNKPPVGKMTTPTGPPQQQQPQRPQSQGPPRDDANPPPKNSIWYEYGCV